jgi:N utilization substance protein A
MVPEDQVPTERYNTGDRIKVFVREVALSTRGPQIMLSRTSEELVRKLFSVEIPEIGDGTVQIKNISREAGSRTKIAVSTNDSSIDPIGACIGQRGVRIQTIIAELGGEKIDVIEWSENPKTYIQNSLSPAKVQSVDLDEAGKSAVIIVNSDQLSLAIGRGGQNVRLAAKLTGWKINIREEGQPATEEVAVEVQE